VWPIPLLSIDGPAYRNTENRVLHPRTYSPRSGADGIRSLLPTIFNALFPLYPGLNPRPPVSGPSSRLSLKFLNHPPAVSSYRFPHFFNRRRDSRLPSSSRAGTCTLPSGKRPKFLLGKLFDLSLFSRTAGPPPPYSPKFPKNCPFYYQTKAGCFVQRVRLSAF